MKNALLLPFLVALISFPAVAGCIEGNGELTTKRIDLDEFTELSLRTRAKIFLYQGPEQKVDIIAESNLIEYLNTDVTGDEWAVSFEKCIIPHKKIEIHITMKTITELEINASNDLVAEGLLKGDELEIEVNGAGDIDLNLEYNKLSTEINGAGDIKYSGKVTIHEIDIRGAGDIKAYDLASEEVEICIKGAGDANLSVSKKLDVSIYGAGDVKYKGDPPVLDVSKVGAGSVRKVE